MNAHITGREGLARQPGGVAAAFERYVGPRAMLAGGPVGFLASLVSNLARGTTFPLMGSPAAGLATGIAGRGLASAATLAIRFARNHMRTVQAQLYDDPRTQDALAHLRRELDVGVMSTRRGSAWLVYETPTSEPVVMGEREYEAMRPRFAQLNEVTVEGGTIAVRRTRDGKLDSSHTAAPALTVYDAVTGSPRRMEWHVEGTQVTKDAALGAYEAYRIENDRGPHESIRFNSLAIVRADAARAEARRAAGQDPAAPAAPETDADPEPASPSFR